MVGQNELQQYKYAYALLDSFYSAFTWDRSTWEPELLNLPKAKGSLKKLLEVVKKLGLVSEDFYVEMVALIKEMPAYAVSRFRESAQIKDLRKEVVLNLRNKGVFYPQPVKAVLLAHKQWVLQIFKDRGLKDVEIFGSLVKGYDMFGSDIDLYYPQYNTDFYKVCYLVSQELGVPVNGSIPTQDGCFNVKVAPERVSLAEFLND